MWSLVFVVVAVSLIVVGAARLAEATGFHPRLDDRRNEVGVADPSVDLPRSLTRPGAPSDAGGPGRQ
jgi:hypothetical protein